LISLRVFYPLVINAHFFNFFPFLSNLLLLDKVFFNLDLLNRVQTKALVHRLLVSDAETATLAQL